MNLGSSPNTNPLITNLAGVFGVSSSSTGDKLKLYNGLNSYAGSVASGDHIGDDEGAPKLFVTILFFDKNYNFVDAAWDQVSTVGAQTSPSVKQPPHDLLTKTVKSPVAGYAYIFFSNEHYNYVDAYFDDASIAFTPSPIIATDDYYPFGLTFNSYRRENSLENKIRFQDQEHIGDLGLNWDSFKWRNHQPDIGRFFNVDPLAEKYLYNSVYAFSENRVIDGIELEGLEYIDIGETLYDSGNPPPHKEPGMDATDKMLNGAKNMLFGGLGAAASITYIGYTGGAGSLLGGGIALSLSCGEFALGMTQFVDGANESATGRVSPSSELIQRPSNLVGLVAYGSNSENAPAWDAGGALIPAALSGGVVKPLLKSPETIFSSRTPLEFGMNVANTTDAALDLKEGVQEGASLIRNMVESQKNEKTTINAEEMSEKEKSSWVEFIRSF